MEERKKINARYLRFEECEHEGDMSNYVEDLIKSGAKVKNKNLDYEEECCEIIVEIDDYEAFYKKFERTFSFAFTHLPKP